MRSKKGKRDKKPSTYPRDHPIFEEIAKRYCAAQMTADMVARAKARANQKARDDITENHERSLKQVNNISDNKSVRLLRSNDRKAVVAARCNYFLTLSMRPCFDKNWSLYNREFQVAKLHKRAATLLYKLFIELDPSLKDKPFSAWPFFIGTMEHFDELGDLTAPHMHILFPHSADLDTVTKIAIRLWAKAVEDAGETGLDLQIVKRKYIGKTASYLLKNSYKDGIEEFDIGAERDKLCRNYNWSPDAIAHDKWRLSRDTLHSAKNARHNVLKYGNSEANMENALRKISVNLKRPELEERRNYLRLFGLLPNESINKSEPLSNGAEKVQEDIHG